MARLRRLHRHRRKNGRGYFHHPQIFYLHQFHDHGLPAHRLFVRGILDQCEAVYFECEAESIEVSIIGNDIRDGELKPIGIFNPGFK